MPPAQPVVDFPQGFHKGVVLAVSGRRFLIGFPLDLDAEVGHRAHAVGQLEAVIHHVDQALSRGVSALQDIGDDVREVFRGKGLLLVSQFHHAPGHQLHLFRCKLDSQGLQVLDDVGLPAGLAQGVVPVAAETLRMQGILVQAPLLVAVCVHPAGLGKDIFSHQRHVGRDAHPRNGLHVTAHVHERTFFQGILLLQVVVQQAQGAGYREVAGPFAQTVHRGVDAPESGFDGLESVGGGQVIVVVGMEIEMDLRVAFHHLGTEEGGLGGIQHPQRVR